MLLFLFGLFMETIAKSLLKISITVTNMGDLLEVESLRGRAGASEDRAPALIKS